VGGELGGDLGFQRLNLGVEAGHHGGQGAGHVGAGGSLRAGGAARRGPQPLMQFGWARPELPAGAGAVTVVRQAGQPPRGPR
jgi:hypothetical protein